MGLGNERNQQTLGVFLLTQKPDPLITISSGLFHHIFGQSKNQWVLAAFTQLFFGTPKPKWLLCLVLL